MKAPLLPVLGALCWAAPALGGEFDGLYKQGPDDDCTRVGVDGGALRIDANVFKGVETECTMHRPVDVIGMQAYLYDMECSNAENTWSARALFMHAADDGLIMVWNGYAFKYDRCSADEPGEGDTGVVTDTSVTGGASDGDALGAD